MFSQYNPQYNIERLKRQKEEIDALINNYQQMPQQQPINNIINSSQPQNTNNNLIEWRILNENEEVDNLYVNNKTLFINENIMVLKGTDGSLEKWQIKKIYPIDKKDERINQLEEEIRKLKEMINDEHPKSNKSTVSKFKSDVNDDGTTKSDTKTDSK